MLPSSRYVNTDTSCSFTDQTALTSAVCSSKRLHQFNMGFHPSNCSILSATKKGATEFMRIPSALKRFAYSFVNPSIAARRVPLKGVPNSGSWESHAEILTIAPPPACRIGFVTSLAMRTTLRNSISKFSTHISSEMDSKSGRGGSPKLFTTASMQPN